MKSLTVFRRAAAAVAVAACFLGASAFAFTVVRNINSTHEPKDLMVVFDKTRNPTAFKPEDKQNTAAFAFAGDGALQIKITKQQSAEVILPFPQVMDISKANFVLLTCKLEGKSRISWQGNWRPWQPYTGEKLWWAAATTDTEGRRSAAVANLDSSSPDGFLPTTMTTIRLPAMFFAQRGDDNRADPSQTNALMLMINSTRDTTERDFVMTIDRISIAE